MSDLTHIGSVNIITNQTLTASGGETPSVTTEPLKMDQLSKLHVYARNTGSSTSVKINIHASNDLSKTMTGIIHTLELTAGSDQAPSEAWFYFSLEAIPSVIFVSAVNADDAHTAVVKVVFDRWR